MVSAPSCMAWSRKALNLISALHRMSGLGVRPAWYSLRKELNTRSLYSLEKLTASMGMPMVSATETASSKSWRDEQYSSLSSSSQFFMNRPITSYPCSLSNRAETEESTPPDMPTTIRDLELIFTFVLSPACGGGERSEGDLDRGNELAR